MTEKEIREIIQKHLSIMFPQFEDEVFGGLAKALHQKFKEELESSILTIDGEEYRVTKVTEKERE